MAAPQRHAVLHAQRYLPLLAGVLALVTAMFVEHVWLKVGFAACAAIVLAGWFYLQATRPVVVVDDDGWAVERGGEERLRVRWSEVVKVKADAQEKAAYVDCGDKARNLLVPPRRGYGFRFEASDALYDRIVAAVPDRVELVDRLDAPQNKS